MRLDCGPGGLGFQQFGDFDLGVGKGVGVWLSVGNWMLGFC